MVLLLFDLKQDTKAFKMFQKIDVWEIENFWVLYRGNCLIKNITGTWNIVYFESKESRILEPNKGNRLAIFAI